LAFEAAVSWFITTPPANALRQLNNRLPQCPYPPIDIRNTLLRTKSTPAERVRRAARPWFQRSFPCLDEETAIGLVVTAVLVQNVNEVVVIDGTNVADRHARLQFKSTSDFAGFKQNDSA
jgi:hypothetical protein